MGSELKLQNNDRVAIIGAGPAGSLFAYLLGRLARREKLHFQVDIYDPRDFSSVGPGGCNKCAGVISPSLGQRLKRVGIDLDRDGAPIQSILRGYLWNTESGCLRVEFPGGYKPIRTVFRGGGPYADQKEGKVSFDDYLLQRAIGLGVRYIPARVVGMEFPERGAEPLRVNLQQDERQWQIEAELVVGAFGLNSSLVEQFAQMGIGYHPPKWVRVAQVELRRCGSKRPLSDKYITVSNVYGQRVRQLVLTPKGEYATLTLLGRGDLNYDDMEKVKKAEELADMLHADWEWPDKPCVCFPRLELRCARNFYRDRLVMVGDAACCRYYKNGIESALRSAEAAVNCVVCHGLSKSSFHRCYYRRIWREIIHDNVYGKMLLSFNKSFTIQPRLMRLFMQARASVVRPRIARRHDFVIWDILTGNRSYRSIFFRMIQPGLFAVMSLHLLRLLWNRFRVVLSSPLKKILRPIRAILRRAAQKVFRLSSRSGVGGAYESSDRSGADPYAGVAGGLRRLPVLGSGSRVSIIGGGPAGTSCAITLMRLAREQNIELEVTIHEPKDFWSATVHDISQFAYDDRRFNQCIGVLSPPIGDIISRQLGIRFPDELVQKHILGYVLHGSHQMITLDESYGSSYALRRIMFDAHMMRQAVLHGVRVNQAEVVDIERKGRFFTLVTTGGTAYADVVVGAFGINQRAADIFERVFGYQRPEYMQTMVTKLHPPLQFLQDFGLRIHAFLPPLEVVEFGAITPKFNHLTVNIAGRKVDESTIKKFMALGQVAALLPDKYEEKGNEIYYPGCFPTSPAKNFFADRMVMIGDSSGMLRPFKGKGINSAILSGIAAGRVMVRRGVGSAEFQHYYLPTFRQITEDIWYARTARWMTNMLANNGGMDMVLNVARQSPALRRALTEAVAGACTYKTILHRLTTERILWRSGAALLRRIFQGGHEGRCHLTDI